MHRPIPDSPTDRRERRCAGGGTERDAHTPGPFAHHPWPESVAEKVELKSRMIFTSTLIPAIDDFRLVRMQRQSAISKPRLKSSPQRRGLVLCAAVANRIVGIALERYVREIPAHPHIERIVKKEIRQERADNPTLRRPSLSPDEELCGKVGDGVNQAADLISATASIPSLNFIPLTTFGNWFRPCNRRQVMDAAI